jgi:hypothetical protein
MCEIATVVGRLVLRSFHRNNRETRSGSVEALRLKVPGRKRRVPRYVEPTYRGPLRLLATRRTYLVQVYFTGRSGTYGLS